ncbi:uncharacterized protein METZ01_LOCUS190281, partial [marine metagenome]
MKYHPPDVAEWFQGIIHSSFISIPKPGASEGLI